MFAFQVAFGPLASQGVHGLWLGCDLHCGHGGSGPMASSRLLGLMFHLPQNLQSHDSILFMAWHSHILMLN